MNLHLPAASRLPARIQTCGVVDKMLTFGGEGGGVPSGDAGDGCRHCGQAEGSLLERRL